MTAVPDLDFGGVRVKCDSCDDESIEFDEEDMPELDDLLAAEGWRTLAEGKHICPDCDEQFEKGTSDERH